MRIGLIGNGFVGRATSILESDDIEIIIYDIIPEECSPRDTTLEDISKCELIFICIPTPMNTDGSCYLSILEDVIDKLSVYINFDKSIVVIRSTVPPGTSERLNCYFMPEFLTEKNYKEDFINNTDWIFGLKNTPLDNLFKKKIEYLINTSAEYKKIQSNNIIYTPTKEAELIKLFRNNFLSLKVSFCNEIYDYCNKINVDYDVVSEVACLDKRIGNSHISVPGHDGKRGFGGTCFPKDTNNLLDCMKKESMKSYIVDAMVKRNTTKDRVEQDWKNNKGRAVI